MKTLLNITDQDITNREFEGERRPIRCGSHPNGSNNELPEDSSDSSDGSLRTPSTFPWQNHVTSIPTSRGQFATFERVGNTSTNLDGTYLMAAGDTPIRFPTTRRRLTELSSTSSDDSLEQTRTQSELLQYISEPANWKK